MPAEQDTGFKVCVGCFARLPVEAFHRKPDGIQGRAARCAECRRYQDLMRQYGITRDEYETLAADGCQICGEPDAPTRRLDVDHDHDSDTVRGVLCMNCNQGVGRFQDSPRLLRRAAEYLEAR